MKTKSSAPVAGYLLVLGCAAAACGLRDARAGDATALPPLPGMGPEGNLRPNVGPPPPPSQIDSKGNPIPPPPEPPARPSGNSNTYYSTCGGTHPPVKYSFPGYSDYEYKDGKYQLTDEAQKYFDSPGYKKYAADLSKYKTDYAANPGTYGEVNPATGRRVDSATAQELEEDEESGIGLSGSGKAVRLDRNPKKDLATWFRGLQYHDPVKAVTFEGPAEAATALEEPQAGPGATASYYGKLVGMLEPSVQANAPSPQKMLETLEILWESQWRRNLGLDSDPTAKQLALDLERAARGVESARRMQAELLRRAASDELVKLQLHEQIASAGRELQATAAREGALREQLERRMLFIRAIAELLRLAPEGGFGPTFTEANLKAVQASAGKVLAQVGPLAAGTVWQGLSQDVLWLERHKAEAGKATDEFLRRRQAAEAEQALLQDPRLDGLAAVADFLRAQPVAPGCVLRKAFELLDRLGTLCLRPETLAALPRLMEHMKHEDGDVAERARWVLTRVLSARAGKVSMEDSIGHLAPLVSSSDKELAEAALNFLNYHTGQNLGRDPQAWLALQQRMRTEREKIKAELAKTAAPK